MTKHLDTSLYGVNIRLVQNYHGEDNYNISIHGGGFYNCFLPFDKVVPYADKVCMDIASRRAKNALKDLRKNYKQLNSEL